MEYYISDNKIIIPKQKDFNPKDILTCGQVFRFENFDNCWTVNSGKEFAKIIEEGENYQIISTNCEYFANYFDLNNNYEKIKTALRQDNVLKNVIKFGEGIRILKGDLLEVIFSFVISANNNISRIKKIINILCEKAGQDMGGYYAFPSLEALSTLPFEFYSSLGAGYRDKYLFKLSRQLVGVDLDEKKRLNTTELRNWLISLAGIGPKVADCILLFGFGRTDVFPVDTWIEKVYNTCYYSGNKNRKQIAEFLVNRFGDLAGYAQQYLFYGARSFDVLKSCSNKTD